MILNKWTAMNNKNMSAREYIQSSEHLGVTGCKATDYTGAICGETFSLDILRLFNGLYSDRIKKVTGNSEVVQETLQWWIQDLTEQNFLLVDTIERLEQEIISQIYSMESETQRKAPCQNFSTQTETSSCSQCATYTQTISDARTSSAQTECQNLSEARTQTQPSPIETPPWVNHLKALHLARTSSAQTECQNLSEARTQTQPSPIETPPWVNHLKALHLARPKCSTETQTSLPAPPIIPHQSSAFRTLTSASNVGFFGPVPSARSTITLSRGTQTNERGYSAMSRPTQTPPVYWVSRFTQTMVSRLTVEKSVQAEDFVPPGPGRLGDKGSLLPMAMRLLLADASTQTTSAGRVDAATETGPESLRTQLAETKKQVQGLHNMLRDSHKASHDTQEALTLEVAQKHDQILALKKEVQQLEERLLHADKQTHFKDDIIREMRKQLKMASSKVNSVSPEPITMRTKRIGFGHDCDYPLPERSTGCEHTSTKNCNKADMVTSLQTELRSMEKELNQCRRAIVSGASLSDLEEFRVRTVEAQAAVEDLRDELGELVSESRDYETQMEVVIVALENCSIALGCARSRLSNWRPPNKENSTSSDSDGLCLLVESAREALQQAANCADGFLRGRETRQELRQRRERRVDRLQEELDGAHDAMRDGVETLSKAVNAKSRQMADQMQNKGVKDVCDGLECVHLDRLNKLQEEVNIQKTKVMDSPGSQTESTQSAEWLRTEVNILTRNLQAKEKMLADKEEMVSLLQDSLERAREEIRTFKEQPMKKELLMDLKEMHHQFQLCFSEAARQEQWLICLRSAVHELRERAERESRHAAIAEQEADRLRSVALLQTARGSLLEQRLQMVEERLAQLEFESCSNVEPDACWRVPVLENII